MARKHPLKVTTIASLIAVLLLSSFGFCCNATSVFAPTWLQIGSYAMYTFPEGTILMSNNTNPLGFDSVDFTDSTFRWECIDLNETIAKLRVTLTFIDAEGKTAQLETELYVNVLSRAIYLQNGTVIGTTRLWLPANPTPNDDITMWDVPPEKVTVKISNETALGNTPQGNQKAFLISAFGDGTINGKSVSFHGLWDFDTGVMIDDYPRDTEPVFTALGIKKFMPSVTVFSDTNIDLGPSDNPLDLRTIFIITALPIAFAILFIAVYRRRTKRKQ